MGSYAYILVSAFILTSSVALMGLYRDTNHADQTIGRYEAKVEARDLAHTGLNLVLRKLGADQNPWTDTTAYSFGETAYERGTFEATVNSYGPGGDTVDVTVVGRIGHIDARGVGRDTTHTVEARVVRGTVLAIPPGFRNAINTDNYLLLQGSMIVESYWKTTNANVHTNGTLRTRGNNFVVEGYGTYTTSSTTTEVDNFTPNVDWNGGASNVFQKDSVHLPLLDMDNLRSISTLHELSDYTIDGDGFAYSSFGEWGDALGVSGVGTLTNPFILVVEGNLEINNEWNMDGYGMIVTASDAEINPSGTGGGVKGVIDGYNTTMGLYAVGNIDINGNAEMTVSLYSHEKVTFHGTPTLTGGIVAKEAHFLGGGNPIVTYVGPGVGIVKPGFTYREGRGPVIIASAEW